MDKILEMQQEILFLRQEVERWRRLYFTEQLEKEKKKEYSDGLIEEMRQLRIHHNIPFDR